MEFIEGLRAFKPHEKAPDFLKANLLISRDDRNKFLEWVANQPDGDIRIDIKESKKETYYCALNDYKKPEAPNNQDVDINDLF